MPTIDLIPMLTVMMGVLGFFVVTSTLIAVPPDRVEVTVPDGTAPQAIADPQERQPLTIRLQSEAQAIVDGETVNQAQALDQVAQFISTNDQDPVILVAEPQVPYDSVVQWLTAMRNTGGERVSLGIDSSGAGTVPLDTP
ncbi:MAG: biopolymer transporter ExbD [Cyanobacteria bacterium P01_G01_bin.54]